MSKRLSIWIVSIIFLALGSTTVILTNEMQTFASKSEGQLKQIPSEPTDFPGSNPDAVQVDVASANKDSIGAYHVRGTIKNLGDSNLEFVKVTGIFYDTDNKTVGVTTCCYTDPDSIEPGRTASFDSFAQEIEVSGTPTSFRISIDWQQ